MSLHDRLMCLRWPFTCSICTKKAIAAAASTACTIKAVLDTPILTTEGELTEASEKVTKEIGERIYK